MASQQDNAAICLLPWPAALTVSPGANGGNAAVVGSHGFDVTYPRQSSPRLQAAVERLAEDFAGGEPSPSRSAAALTIDVRTLSERYPGLAADESYQLTIDAAGISLTAQEEWGALRGIATLTQLFAAGDPLPPLAIDDRPRFAWRGLLLDVARHFLSADALRRTLDGMALCKLNVLHLHLSDDQGFRFPSRAYPRLASQRCFSVAELTGLVEHAADLGIRIVPELDMPGHVTSWLVAYPEWGSRQVGAATRFGVHEACLDPTREDAYLAIEELLKEVAEVFPDSHIHIGGDEVHPAWWSDDPRVAALMQAQGLHDIRDVQASFNRRVGDIVTSLGKEVVAWDEVLHPTLDADWIVQAWRGSTARDQALSRGNRVLVSAPYYLDLQYPADVHYAFDPAAAQSELIDLEDLLLEDCRFEHVAQGMRWTERWRRDAVQLPPSPQRDADILGGEACLWGELVDEQVLDVRLWSRLPAVAERFWSPRAVADPVALDERLAWYLDRVQPLRGENIFQRSAAQIAGLGIGPQWQDVLAMLEPVKWYGRLLGEQALQARIRGEEMPQARPYDINTPLNRLVDYLPPQSQLSVRLERLCGACAQSAAARHELEELALRWRLAGELPDPPEVLMAMIAPLVRLSEIVLLRLRGTAVDEQDLAFVAQPRGELLLALGPVLCGWLRAGS